MENKYDLKEKEIFIPYIDGKLAFTTINGHKLLIVSEEEDEFYNSFFLENNQVKPLKEVKELLSNPLYTDEEALSELAKKDNLGLVIAPPEVALDTLIATLEEEIPWVQ